MPAIKQIHYPIIPQIRARNEKEPGISERDWKARIDSLEAGAAVQPPPRESMLVSSAFGTLDRLLFTLPEYVFDTPAYVRVYKDLFSQLPDRVRYIFVAKESNQPTLRRWIKEL